MGRNEGKAGGGGSACEPAFETGYFQFANFNLIFQCVKCDKIRMTQPCKNVKIHLRHNDISMIRMDTGQEHAFAPCLGLGR